MSPYFLTGLICILVPAIFTLLCYFETKKIKVSIFLIWFASSIGTCLVGYAISLIFRLRYQDSVLGLLALSAAGSGIYNLFDKDD